jgi:hypothetical protein
VLVSPRCSTFLVAAALGSLLLACPRKAPPQRARSVPVCATQDCATGRIVDDGCTDDGRCASCVNACPGPAVATPPVAFDAASSVVLDAAPAPAAPPAPAPPSQLRALAGEGTAGVFWIPAKGDFPFEDLLLQRDGQYVTHLHDRPGASGTWQMDGDALTLEGWMGDGPYVLRRVHVDEHELRGFAEGTMIVLRRMR